MWLLSRRIRHDNLCRLESSRDGRNVHDAALDGDRFVGESGDQRLDSIGAELGP